MTPRRPAMRNPNPQSARTLLRPRPLLVLLPLLASTACSSSGTTGPEGPMGRVEGQTDFISAPAGQSGGGSFGAKGESVCGRLGGGSRRRPQHARRGNASSRGRDRHLSARGRSALRTQRVPRPSRVRRDGSRCTAAPRSLRDLRHAGGDGRARWRRHRRRRRLVRQDG